MITPKRCVACHLLPVLERIEEGVFKGLWTLEDPCGTFPALIAQPSPQAALIAWNDVMDQLK